MCLLERNVLAFENDKLINYKLISVVTVLIGIEY